MKITIKTRQELLDSGWTEERGGMNHPETPVYFNKEMYRYLGMEIEISSVGTDDDHVYGSNAAAHWKFIPMMCSEWLHEDKPAKKLTAKERQAAARELDRGYSLLILMIKYAKAGAGYKD